MTEVFGTMLYILWKTYELQNEISDMIADAFPLYKICTIAGSVLAVIGFLKKIDRKNIAK